MIGILTFHFAHNYGAMLQAFALKTYLGKKGNDVKIIDYRSTKMAGQYALDLDGLKLHKKPLRLYRNHRRSLQARLFQDFMEQELDCGEGLKKSALRDYVKDFEAVICGSDQVWNTALTFDDSAYFLDFVPSGVMKIGYAISIGQRYPNPQLARNLSRYLSGFTRLSYREESAAEMVGRLTGDWGKVSVDPVFLLDKEEWREEERKPEGFGLIHFILYYSLEKNERLEYETKKLSDKTGLPIVSIHPMCRKPSFRCLNLRNVGPKEFVWLVDHAEYICSNSFHGAAFASIFDKKILMRMHKTLGDRNRQLLFMHGMSESDCEEIIDFFRADKTLLIERLKQSREELDFRTDGCEVHRVIRAEYPKAFAARCKNRSVVVGSSSGGMFTVLSDKMIDMGGCVIAAGYNYERHRVEHRVAMTKEECAGFRGSKYIQSYIGDVLKQCRELLSAGTKVLFVGTACQIAGLKEYLLTAKVDTGELMLCDVICHGVPSPKIWSEYITNKEKSLHRKFNYITFRDKRKGWEKPTSIAKCGDYEVSIQDFSTLFYSDVFLRPSCYRCPFANVDKPSDITIGDFWGIKEVIPDFYDEMGNSLVLLHTSKAEKMFQEIQNEIVYQPCNALECLQINLLKPTDIPEHREKIWREYNRVHLNKIIYKYFPSSVFGKVIRKLRRVLRHEKF